MENADALDLSKENIHPLKGGRNTTQLGLALQAQTDVQIQQMLLKTQEAYEQEIRIYQGPDPLLPWVDYIAWVEQSFPKQGPEGHLHVLLHKCYLSFRSEDKYKNDIRFVRLCIKFAETQQNFKEFFSVLYNEGIGHTVTEFYLNWAYKLQLINEWNIADEIFQTGMKNMAQPADDLINSYKRFLNMRDIAFNSQGMQEDVGESNFFGDQRQPMAALKSLGKKGLAPHVRVGQSIRSHLPGTLPVTQGPSGRPSASSRLPIMRGNNTAPVSVYQERGDPQPDLLTITQNAQYSSIIPQSVNKENERKPGPWTNQALGSRKHQSTSSYTSSMPKHPGFEVHKDEEAAKDSDVHVHSGVKQNVLQTRKGFEDGFHDAMYIFEEPNPNVRPMYPKAQVYAGGKEFQLEELRALKYFQKRAEREAQERGMQSHLHQAHVNQIERNNAEIQKASETGVEGRAIQAQLHREHMVQVDIPHKRAERVSQERVMQSHLHQELMNHRDIQNMETQRRVEMEAQERAMQSQLHQTHIMNQIETQNVQLNDGENTARSLSEASYLLKQHDPTLSSLKDFHIHQIHSSPMPNVALHHQASGTFPEHHSNEMERHPLLASSLVTARTRPANTQVHFNNFHPQHHLVPSLAEVVESEQDVHSTNSAPYANLEQQQFQPQMPASRASNQSIYNQSMTVHTKLAMHEIGNLWGSPCPLKSGDSSRSIHDSSPVPLETKKASSFKICQDDTLAPSIAVGSAFRCEDRSTTPEPSFSGTHKLDSSPIESLKISPLRLSSAPKHAEPTPMAKSLIEDDNKMETAYGHTDPELFEDPPSVTTYRKRYDGFQVYQEEHYSPPVSTKPVGNFQVFCDNDRSPSPSVLPTSDRDSSTSTGSSIHKIAKEKENMHKFPQADFEVMEECGPAPIISTQCGPQQMDLHPFGVVAPPLFNDKVLHLSPTNVNAESIYPTVPQKSLHPLSSNPPLEPMDDDVTVAAPHQNIDMSVTGITQAFVFPKFAAASTPFRSSSSSKKSPKSKKSSSPSSLLKQSEESPKTVPPLKLYRVRDSLSTSDPHLSVIYENSKEKHGNTSSSGGNISSTMGSRYVMYSTQRQSIANEPAAQPDLSFIPETSDVPLPEKETLVPEKRSMNELQLRLSQGKVNPFDPKLISEFLYHMGFPLPHHMDGYSAFDCAVPSKRNNILNLGGDSYNIVKALGEGAYAKVLRGVHLQSQREVALKVQKPSCRWEYYICREIRKRLSDQQLASAFMTAEQIYVYSNGSVIVTELLPFGTLLTLVNKVVASTKRQMLEPQVLFLVDQLISAVSALHKCDIIHGDLKPDNVLLRTIPSVSSEWPCIQLIDFGRSIDMSLMPPGTTFNQMVLTDTFTCVEMQTGRPWTFQTDLYGLANIAHCLLLGGYMKVQESRTTGRWTIQPKLPRSYSSELWPKFFDALLNIESCDVLPDLDLLQADLRARMGKFNNLSHSVASLGNMIMRR